MESQLPKIRLKTYAGTIFALALLLVLGLGAWQARQKRASDKAAYPSAAVKTPQSPAPTTTPAVTSEISAPLSRALERVAKKPFGLKVSPQDSPVSPERFSGYHTGVDFETFPEEQEADVSVFTVCAGQLLQKRLASGYGGVAVQICKVNGQEVTVVYGHLRLASITARPGQALAAGELLGALGEGFSPETDGERKHLHLSIHLGKSVNIAGYVKIPAELDRWLDAEALLKE